MSLVPPASVPMGANAVNTVSFPAILAPYPNVQPFSYPDGLTFQKLFESYRHWLLSELVPHVDTQADAIIAAYNAASQALAIAMNDYKVEIGADRDAFNALVEETLNDMSAAIAANAADMSNKITAANTAKTAAEAARDMAQQWAANTQVLQDDAVYNLTRDKASKAGGYFHRMIAEFNVLDYGASVAAADNAQAFANAIAAATSVGGGIVTVPEGTYKVSKITAAPRVTILGRGTYSTNIQAVAGSSEPALIVSPAGMLPKFWIKNLGLKSNGNTGQHALYFKAVGDGGTPSQGGWWYGGLENVRIDRFDGHGIWLRGGGTSFTLPHQFLSFRNVEVFAGPKATSYSLYFTGQVGQVDHINCEYDGNVQGVIGVTTGVYISREVTDAGGVASDVSPYAITFNTCTFQAHAQAAYVDRAGSIKFDNSWFEDNKNGLNATNSVESCVVESCTFSDTGTQGDGNGYAIRAGSNSVVSVGGNRFIGAYENAYTADNTSGSIVDRGGNRATTAAIPTKGVTKQPAVNATDGSVNLYAANTALIGSGPQIKTIISKKGVGEMIFLRALSADFTIASGGNISLGTFGNSTTPVTIPNNATAVLVKFDLLVSWQLISIK